MDLRSKRETRSIETAPRKHKQHPMCGGGGKGFLMGLLLSANSVSHLTSVLRKTTKLVQRQQTNYSSKKKPQSVRESLPATYLTED